MITRQAQRRLALGLASAFLVAVLGCPRPTPTNQSPTANAGPDQTVAGGSTVTLNGSGSTDPQGRTLTYQWQQTGGSPTVTLNGANTALATFTAPNQATTLTFKLTVNNGAGGTASDTTVVTVTGAQALAANAGPDQTVTPGSTVNLNGSGSTAPAGQTLTYQWQQTGGTPTVTLSNANTVAASFTAPNQAATLTFQLTVKDNQGNTSSDSTIVTVTTSPVVKPTIYIANQAGSNVTAYDITTPATVNGNIPPNANLAGGQTQLSGVVDTVVDKNGALLALNAGNKSITVYANALSLGNINGNIAPTRNVQGAATLLTTGADSLAINTAADLLFVSQDPNLVLVYASVSTSAFNGNAAPVRTITSTDISGPFGINFGANDELYVANNGASTVSVFANASTLNGTVAASRVIKSAAFASVYDVFIDRNDTMYVVNSAGGGTIKNQVSVFANAATRNGTIMPDSVLIVPGATDLVALTVDSAGNGYIADRGANAIYGYNNIAMRNGTVAPDRTLTGANTLLSGPIAIFEHE